MGSGSVDYERVQFFIPHGRLAEQLAEPLLCIGTVTCEGSDENIRNIIEHIALIGVSTVVFQRITDIPFRSLDNLLHFHL